MRNVIKGVVGGLAALVLTTGGLIYQDIHRKSSSPGFSTNRSSFEDSNKYSGPIKEVRVSWNEDAESKTAVYLQMEEFEDVSKRTFEGITSDGERVTPTLPPECYEMNWTLRMNPFFKDETISDEALKSYQTNYVGKEIKFLTDDPILYGKDRIVYAIFKHPKDIFDYLHNWDGLKIDRLIISAHGSSESLGQNKPEYEYVQLDDLIRKYSPNDFKDIMADKGSIFLKACATNMNYQEKLTMAEGLSWLFHCPVQGSVDESVGFYKTVHPDEVGQEVNDYIRRSR